MRKGQFLSALDPRKINSRTPRSWSTSWNTHWSLTFCGSTRRTSAKTSRLTLRTIGGLLSYPKMCPELCKVSSGNHSLLCSQQWRWGHATQLFEHRQLHLYSERGGKALDQLSSCRKAVCVEARLGTLPFQPDDPENFFTAPDIWPPNSLDCNRLNLTVWHGGTRGQQIQLQHEGQAECQDHHGLQRSKSRDSDIGLWLVPRLPQDCHQSERWVHWVRFDSTCHEDKQTQVWQIYLKNNTFFPDSSLANEYSLHHVCYIFFFWIRFFSTHCRCFKHLMLQIVLNTLTKNLLYLTIGCLDLKQDSWLSNLQTNINLLGEKMRKWKLI